MRLAHLSKVRGVAALLLLAVAAPAAQQMTAAPLPQATLPMVSTFDAGDEGWTIAGDSPPTPNYAPTGGNPNGYIFAIDATQGVPNYFRAPAAFLGNQGAAYGQTLRFDLKQTYDTREDPNAVPPDLILTGGGLTIVFDTIQNPAKEWTRYIVPLEAEQGWHKYSGGVVGDVPTEAEMRQVLANLTDLRIRGEFQLGPDTCALDNVTLGGAALTQKIHLPFVTKH